MPNNIVFNKIYTCTLYNIRNIKEGECKLALPYIQWPIFILIGQYSNQDSWIYTRTPGCLSGLLDVQHPELPNHA